MSDSWLVCEKGYQTKCEDCPIRDENAEPCEHAIEVAPVRHGRWNKAYRSGVTVAEGFVSSCCDMWNERSAEYCPNCGARMDGGVNNETD